jgi:hypothetical protein
LRSHQGDGRTCKSPALFDGKTWWRKPWVPGHETICVGDLVGVGSVHASKLEFYGVVTSVSEESISFKFPGWGAVGTLKGNRIFLRGKQVAQNMSILVHATPESTWQNLNDKFLADSAAYRIS